MKRILLVLINGAPLVEPSVVLRAPWNFPAVTLSGDEFFVIGDNRGMAMQNYDFGRATRTHAEPPLTPPAPKYAGRKPSAKSQLHTQSRR